MEDLHESYLIIGVVVLVLAMGAERIKERLWVSGPLLAMAFGVVAGPFLLDLADPEEWGDPKPIIEELARLTLGFSLMGAALRLPQRYVWRRKGTLVILIGAGMLGMWAISSLLARVMLGLDWLAALVLGAVITPTDPVAAASIVTGRLAERGLPARVRHLVTAESAANDGLAFLLLMLPLTLMHRPTGDALVHWLWSDLLLEVMGGILFGAFVGFAVGMFLRRREQSREEQGSPVLSVTISVVLVLLGGSQLLHLDGILAAFASGLVINAMIRGEQQARHHEIQEVIKRFLDVPVFVFFGTILPWAAWGELGALGVAFAAIVIVARRLPVVAALRAWLEPIQGWRETFLVGWFGPVAVAAMVYGAWAETHGAEGPIWPISSLVIFCSVILHGLTATPLTRWSAARIERTAEREEAERGDGERGDVEHPREEERPETTPQHG